MCYRVGTLDHRVGIRELRQNASAIIKRVLSGEVIEVTEHGHPVARIVPLYPSALDQLILEGRATEAAGDLLELMDELHLPVPARRGKRHPSDVVAELRADEP